MGKIMLGEVEITRVVELRGGGMPRSAIFPDSDDQLWVDNADLLVPRFWDRDVDAVRFNVQSWVLHSEGRTILIDTGVGNDRERPNNPMFAHWHTDFLGNLAAAGVRPADVDLVVCTHVHGDHVGWNTQRVDGEWVPTFPNARYLIPRADFDYWHPEHGDPNRSARMVGVFEDSVLPVYRAGLVDLWGEAHDVDANLRIEPAPGHTPGSSVITLHSGRDRALFVGDLVHSPVQLTEPNCGPALDEDRGAAGRSRRRILARAAEQNALLVPAHFPGSSALEIRAGGGGFEIVRWAGFDPS